MFRNACKSIFFLFLLISAPQCIYSDNSPQFMESDNIHLSTGPRISWQKYKTNFQYYLYVSDFISSFILIPSSNVFPSSNTSAYYAGRAPLYNTKNEKVGICSASFLCMNNLEDIFVDISNYLFIENGLIVTWFTPTTLVNLELDSIVHSMVTECIVIASTKVGVNPYYGNRYNMIVSSDDQKIYFTLTQIPN